MGIIRTILSMTPKIVQDHLISYIARTPCAITANLKYHDPNSLSLTEKSLVGASRFPNYQQFDYLTYIHPRSVFDMHMDIVGAHHIFYNLDTLGFKYLYEKLPQHFITFTLKPFYPYLATQTRLNTNIIKVCHPLSTHGPHL